MDGKICSELVLLLITMQLFIIMLFIMYMQFIIDWNVLKMKQIKNSPASIEEYERKARNWLNGRRAPNYAQTLFPDMIKAAEQVWSRSAVLCLPLSHCVRSLFASACADSIDAVVRWRQPVSEGIRAHLDVRIPARPVLCAHLYE